MKTDEVGITPSIIDRLIDLEPDASREPLQSRTQSVSELRNSVLRDIECLLNTRIPLEAIPEGLEETKASLANYGLPDFVGLSSRDSDDRNRLTRSIEDALRTFEPRLINLSVEMKESTDLTRGVVFHISGDLRLEPTPVPIAFDTILNSGKGEIEVTQI